MNSKPHRTNSDFQLRYFLAGDCKTPDGAWSLMYSQRVDIENKLRHSDAQKLRRDAKILAAEEVINNVDAPRVDVLNAMADKAEAEADIPIWNLNLQAARMELATIIKLMDELEPLRKYGHLPLLEATEACQQEEWLLELQCRAQMFLTSQGTIPWDHLNTMACHPQFQSDLVPFITNLTAKLSTIKGPDEGMKLMFKPSVFETPAIETSVVPSSNNA